jgi:hypothetical protein
VCLLAYRAIIFLRCVREISAGQSIPFVRQAPANRPPLLQMLFLWTGFLLLPRSSWPLQANSAAQLAEIFAQQRRDNIDLSGVAVIDPQLTLLPQIEANGMMRMAGFFPSVPTQVNFELLYAPVGGRWRLFGLSVSFGQAAPAAPQPPAAAPPAAQPKEKAPQAQAPPR